MNKKTIIARKLRNNATEAEKKLWYFLRNLKSQGFKFRRQQPLGNYFVDFVCLSHNLIIEVDGGQHYLSENDKVRDEWLNKEGFTVLRFWNNQIIENIEGVMLEVLKYCK